MMERHYCHGIRIFVCDDGKVFVEMKKLYALITGIGLPDKEGNVTSVYRPRDLALKHSPEWSRQIRDPDSNKEIWCADVKLAAIMLNRCMDSVSEEILRTMEELREEWLSAQFEQQGA